MIIMVDIRCLKCGSYTHANHEQISSMLLGPMLMRNNRKRAFECAGTASISIALDKCDNCAGNQPREGSEEG